MKTCVDCGSEIKRHLAKRCPACEQARRIGLPVSDAERELKAERARNRPRGDDLERYRDRIEEMRARGMTFRAIAAELGRDHSTIRYHLRQMRKQA